MKRTNVVHSFMSFVQPSIGLTSVHFTQFGKVYKEAQEFIYFLQQLTHPMFSVLLVKGRNGKDLLMLHGYTYYQHKILRDGFRWSCTQMGSRSCRGFLHVTNDMFVVRAFTQHTHPPSTYSWKSIKNQRKTNNVSRCVVFLKFAQCTAFFPDYL